MPKNIFTKREDLICGKLDSLEEMLEQYQNEELFDLIKSIRIDATRMELKLIHRKAEAVTTVTKKQPIRIDENGELEIHCASCGTRWFSGRELRNILNKMATQPNA